MIAGLIPYLFGVGTGIVVAAVIVTVTQRRGSRDLPPGDRRSIARAARANRADLRHVQTRAAGVLVDARHVFRRAEPLRCIEAFDQEDTQS